MGFDIYGRRAKSKRGEYFRNNVWWWRPLAHYVLKRVKMSAKEREHYWSTNDGVRVSARTALRIADTLDHLIASGQALKYQRRYEAEQAALPNETCTFCEGTGKESDKDARPCRYCDGKGHRKHWMTNYPFNVENVQEFAQFCRDSSGFEIY